MHFVQFWTIRTVSMNEWHHCRHITCNWVGGREELLLKSKIPRSSDLLHPPPRLLQATPSAIFQIIWKNYFLKFCPFLPIFGQKSLHFFPILTKIWKKICTFYAKCPKTFLDRPRLPDLKPPLPTWPNELHVQLQIEKNNKNQWMTTPSQIVLFCQGTDPSLTKKTVKISRISIAFLAWFLFPWNGICKMFSFPLVSCLQCPSVIAPLFVVASAKPAGQ